MKGAGTCWLFGVGAAMLVAGGDHQLVGAVHSPKATAPRPTPIRSQVAPSGRRSGLDHIARIVLIAPGSITLHSDMSARYVDVTGSLVGGSPGTMQFQLPAGTGRLPRGFYMLFALNSGGIPSVAEWVKVK
jgi:Galactose oxidase-like, Early set domain